MGKICHPDIGPTIGPAHLSTGTYTDPSFTRGRDSLLRKSCLPMSGFSLAPRVL